MKRGIKMKVKYSVSILLDLTIFLFCSSCTPPIGDATNIPGSSNQNLKESETPEEILITQPSQEVKTTPELQTSTPESNLFLPGESIVMIYGEIGETSGYYLINMNTGKYTLLEVEGEPVFTVYNWLENKCEIIVGIANIGHIVRINLSGQIISTIYNKNDSGGDKKLTKEFYRQIINSLLI
jgi:hypothetical protein